MKTSIITSFIIALIVQAGSVSAQTLAVNTMHESKKEITTSATLSEEMEERAVKAFYKGLSHDSEGIVEASIYNLIRLRVEKPEGNYDRHIRKMQELVTDSKSERIRMMAFIGYTYMENPYLYLNVKPLLSDNELKADHYDEFFQELSMAMQQEYLNERVSRRR